MIDDLFTITVLMMLEDLGFCKKAKAVRSLKANASTSRARSSRVLNTDGGGLSSNHPGMRDLPAPGGGASAAGRTTSQKDGARLAVAHGNGENAATSHTGGTIILAGD